eukprot:TRINITY_DN558_c0_g1_i2.p1 TRINITY_DN558_c0_g1~~TRINITY_DN558_c0_g1_i2.p1  ORF type:complete len:170 (+),score=25.86 TRINITY_DN558_c0_g1_i2:51-512(+)
MASAEEHSAYLRDGFFIRRGMFDAEEIAILRACAISDELQRGAYELDDGEGLKTKMVLWNTVGQDAFGLVARSSRIVRTVESLLGGEVYHYHSKLIMKQPWTGGSFAWHQDYGYWYIIKTVSHSEIIATVFTLKMPGFILLQAASINTRLAGT